jgi:xanthine dehydrogenase molybdopterin-binding subunit B
VHCKEIQNAMIYFDCIFYIFLFTAALESAPCRVKGTASAPAQYHFQLGNQATVCIPTDLGGMDIYTTTQFIDGTQATVAEVLDIPMARYVL